MAPLAGVRVLEVAILAPDSLSMHLADLGAEVIKVEEPALGDYVRDIGFLKVDGISALHRRWNRGKHSIGLDLRHDEGRQVFEELVAVSDVVVEGLRPGALERRGLGYERLRELNPSIVLTSLSGYGQSGPYRDLASHGVAYDAYAGFAPPVVGPQNWPTIPAHVAIGMHAAALFGAMATVSAVLGARINGTGMHLDVAEADAAAWWNGPLLEAERWLNERSGRSLPPSAGHRHSVRYQYYATADREYVLFMATEEKFWRHFCDAIGDSGLYERHPPRSHSDHDSGNEHLRAELAGIFATRTQREWVDLFLAHDIPGAPVHTGAGVSGDPQFQTRSTWLPAARHGMDVLGSPVKIVGAALAEPAPAPLHGQHTRAVLEEVLGYPAERIDRLLWEGIVAGPAAS